ncbi:MAG: UDP-N-acetylglucosamine 1-carboxyvinyltransferase [Candidatus Delongbacteria bacterium]|nr:MAG: UDP-N-acetylglucosamine 1-carboxyvinyltransferase [Candidatus Delongbacteria bacterium]
MKNSEYFNIKGSKSVNSEIEVSGNKNEALPVIAAALLTKEKVILRNIPAIEDTKIMIQIAKELGCVAEFENNTLTIESSPLTTSSMNDNLSSKIRSSLLFVAPLLHRFKSVKLPNSGGDKIGKRRIDTHLDGFIKMGAKLETERFHTLSIDKPQAVYHLFDEASVMATENIIMFASLIEGKTTIYNAACEPHVQGLCNMLSKMGVKFEGIGTNRLIINGVKQLSGVEHTIGSDHIETGSFIGLAASTNSNLRIKNSYTEHMDVIIPVFRKIGVSIEIDGNDILVDGTKERSIVSDYDGTIPVISDQPWPCFPADLTSIVVVTALFSKGTIVVHEKMFEARLLFTDNLIRMGGKIVLCDPHRVVVNGPSKLKGIEMSSPDIRAGMALLIAALAAKGSSTIRNIRQIDRGYQDIDNRLKKAGFNIERKS